MRTPRRISKAPPAGSGRCSTGKMTTRASSSKSGGGGARIERRLSTVQAEGGNGADDGARARPTPGGPSTNQAERGDGRHRDRGPEASSCLRRWRRTSARSPASSRAVLEAQAVDGSASGGGGGVLQRSGRIPSPRPLAGDQECAGRRLASTQLVSYLEGSRAFRAPLNG
jgi:hypothetical protein